MTAFRLAAVERLRETEVEQCLKELAEAQRQSRHAHQRCALLVKEAENPSAAASAAEFLNEAMYRQRLRDELAEAMQIAAEHDFHLDQARTAWMQARARLAAVQSLHERHDEQQHALAMQRDQRDHDEAALIAHRRAGGAA